MSAGWPYRCTGTMALCASGDGCFDLPDVDVGGVGQTVDEDGRGAAVAHGLGGGDEGVDGNDHLVAGPDADGLQGQAHGIGARTDAGAVARAAVLGERRLEGGALRPQGVGGARGDRLEDVVKLVVQFERLRTKIDERHGCCPRRRSPLVDTDQPSPATFPPTRPQRSQTRRVGAPDVIGYYPSVERIPNHGRS